MASHTLEVFCEHSRGQLSKTRISKDCCPSLRVDESEVCVGEVWVGDGGHAPFCGAQAYCHD